MRATSATLTKRVDRIWSAGLCLLITLAPATASSQADTQKILGLMGMTLSSFSIDTGNSLPIGMGMAVAFDRYYVDLSSNWSEGRGDYLSFASEYTYDPEKRLVGVMNVGLFESLGDKMAVIPVVGIGISRDIYQDTLGWDTYYLDDPKYHGNLGLKVLVRTGDFVGVVVGIGTYERLSACISMVL